MNDLSETFFDTDKHCKNALGLQIVFKSCINLFCRNINSSKNYINLENPHQNLIIKINGSKSHLGQFISRHFSDQN